MNITQLHIEKARLLVSQGEPRSDCCALALALSEHLGKEVRVGFATAWFDGGVIDLPPEVQQFILDFDQGLDVKPTSFNLP